MNKPINLAIIDLLVKSAGEVAIIDLLVKSASEVAELDDLRRLAKLGQFYHDYALAAAPNMYVFGRGQSKVLKALENLAEAASVLASVSEQNSLNHL